MTAHRHFSEGIPSLFFLRKVYLILLIFLFFSIIFQFCAVTRQHCNLHFPEGVLCSVLKYVRMDEADVFMSFLLFGFMDNIEID